MIQKTLLFVSLFLITKPIHLQQISSFGNLDVVDSYYNPAFTAFENDWRFASLYRQLQSNSNNLNQEWKEVIVLAETNFEGWNSGIGIKLHQENSFLTHSRSEELSYRHSLSLGKHSKLALGIGGGYKDFFLDDSGLVFSGEPEDLEETLQTGVNLITGVGFNWKKQLYLGASVLQLNEPRIGIYQFTRHYAIHGLYLLNISETFQLQPQFLWMFTKDVNMLRVNLKAYHNDHFWWMLSSGLNIQFMAAVGVRLFDHLDLGYGIDLFRFPNSKIFDDFLHEVVLTYRIRRNHN